MCIISIILIFYQVKGGICEKAAEYGDFGYRVRRPFHRTLTRGPRRFKLFLDSCAKLRRF
jgi:hypothetical protein